MRKVSRRRSVVGLFALLSACSKPASQPEPTPATAAAPATEAAAPSATATATAAPEPESPPHGSSEACAAPEQLAWLLGPRLPVRGKPLQVLVASSVPLRATLSIEGLRDAQGKPLTHTLTRRGGGPYFWAGSVRLAQQDPLTVRFVQPGCAPIERPIKVFARAHSRPKAPTRGVWSTRAMWDEAHENLYSAWIEAMFDADDAAQLSWASLQEVLRDPERNLLHDYLSADEEHAKEARLRPDCADLPYFLRAYFAWKLRLPFALSACTRGGEGEGPSCSAELFSNEDEDERVERAKERAPDRTGVTAFYTFLRGRVADTAHSGAGRTAFAAEDSDYYPVPLEWDALRPGTVFADPFGHVLMVAKRVPQSRDRGGVLFAVDGQPDGTVARKRFWRGNFLYARDPALGGPGFKAFRPLRRRPGSASSERPRGLLERVKNAQIGQSAGALPLWLGGTDLAVDDFYERVDAALSPAPRDAESALREAIVALDEQVRARVTSVENGRLWLAKHGPRASMPDGPEIFETRGPWEDFATPSRDLRLLIALDVVGDFPARVARHPERFRAGTDRENLASLAQTELAARRFSYRKSDGSEHTLSLADVLARREALELAYNLNDCVEWRWGAAPGSPEAHTCTVRAPAEQHAKMQALRSWFSERKRPARK